jgi:hypothetical protein
MERTVMLGKLWAFVKKHIVGEVPDEMAACLDCGIAQCRDNRYETCSNRLIRAAALGAMQAPRGQPGRRV